MMKRGQKMHKGKKNSFFKNSQYLKVHQFESLGKDG